MYDRVAPDGASTTTYLYQGNTVTVTDAAGNWKQFTGKVKEQWGKLLDMADEMKVHPGVQARLQAMQLLDFFRQRVPGFARVVARQIHLTLQSPRSCR